jgi:hypothetical protein
VVLSSRKTDGKKRAVKAAERREWDCEKNVEDVVAGNIT